MTPSTARLFLLWRLTRERRDATGRWMRAHSVSLMGRGR